MKPIFFYGSLRDAKLLAIVLDREVAPESLVAARAPGFETRVHPAEAYPVLIPAEAAAAEGVLFFPGSLADRDRLAFFEGGEFRLAPLTVSTAEGEVRAEYFRGTENAGVGGARWDSAKWRAESRAIAIEATRELMDHFGCLPRAEIDTLWPGILNRARARAQAPAAPGRVGSLRTPFDAAQDVERLAHRRAFTGYLAVEEHEVAHRRHDGAWTGPLRRVTVAWGDAVTLLPYDPVRDLVLLIEQFRPAPAARGDLSPWCIEVVAGRIDWAGDAEAVARSEAREEAGIAIGRVERLPGYYPTPGLASEYLDGFVGEADLSEAGGIHGNPGEGEDIRAVVLPLDEALAALEAGEVNTGPAMIPLLWLARHRERLAREWGGGPARG